MVDENNTIDMCDDNEDFELTNDDIEAWTTTYFSEPETDTETGYGNAQRDIFLWVGWEDQTAYVLTKDWGIHTSFQAVEYGLAQLFQLPNDTDFAAFFQHYNETIRPLLNEIGQYFYSEYDGHNMRGHWENYDRELYKKLKRAICNVPRHCLEIYNTLDALLDESGREYGIAILLEDLLDGGIDLKTADLNNDEISEKVVQIARSGFTILESDADILYTVRDIQHDLEDEDEDEE